MFSYYWNRFLFWIHTCFPCHNISAETTICVPIEYLTLYDGIPHSIISGQGTHFPAKEVWQWAHAYGIHWSSHHPEAAGLTEWLNNLLKIQFQYQIHGNTLLV